jgi:predicted GNAT family acetyltransferase
MTSSSTDTIEYRFVEKDGHGTFTGWIGGQRASALAYSRLRNDLLLIEHVQTFPPFQGQGNGEGIVRHVVRWARETGHKLMPLCPFARSVFDRSTEIQDVRAGL